MKRNRKRLGRLMEMLVISLTLVCTIGQHSQIAAAVAGKFVNTQGTNISESEIQKVEAFVNEVDKTQGFAVYANTLDRTNHIEGNIYVNNATSGGVNITVQNVDETDTDDYSYVGTSNGGIHISDSSNIVVGNDIEVQKPNENQTILNGGYSNNISVTQLTEEESEAMRAELQSNLNNIASAGSSLITNPDSSFYGSSKDAFESVNNMLVDGTLEKGDVVVINVSYTDLLFNEGAFGNLINNNNGTTVIVNVVCDNSTESINIGKGFSLNTNVATSFNPYSPYLIWNFGNYTGTINIGEEMLGIIVAPEGRVYQAAGNLNGAVVANVAGNSGEIHQVSKTDGSRVPEPTEPEPTEPEPTEPGKTEDYVPRTGDETNIGFYTVIAVLAMFGIAVTAVCKKKVQIK